MEMKELMDAEIKRFFTGKLVESILVPNPWLDKYMAEKKAEWAALPWYKKFYRRLKRKISILIYRLNRAWDALRGIEDY